MVEGVRRFREHFREFTDAFIVIGGVACDEWFAIQSLPFRATKDIDIVIIIETVSATFIERFWEFVEVGGYEVRGRSNGSPIYYRFSRPREKGFPAKLELFTREPEGIDLAPGQRVTPIPTEQEAASLSAILMNDAYYELIRKHCENVDGLPVVTLVALIPLKARAWLDLTKRRESGESVDTRDIKKHRNDVFRLAVTLPGQARPNPGPGDSG